MNVASHGDGALFDVGGDQALGEVSSSGQDHSVAVSVSGASGVIDWSAFKFAAVMTSVGEGRPLLLVGRDSGSAGLVGCRKAVGDLFGAAEELRRHSGVDVVSALPDREVLAERLLSSAHVERSVDERGHSFIHRFLVIDRSSEGLVVTLSTGSGAAVNASGDELHARHLESLLREHRAAGLFAKRFDRLVRDESAIGTTVRALAWLEDEVGPVWVCAGETGEMPTVRAGGCPDASR